jgi:hypothetical protein
LIVAVPFITCVPTAVEVNAILLNVNPLPKLTPIDVPVILICEVPAVKVKFVVVVKSMFPPDVTVLLPRLIARMLVLFELKEATVRLKLLVRNVPAVTVKEEADPSVNASPSVTVIPAPFIIVWPIVLPALINVPVPVNVKLPVCVNVIPATSVMLPATVIFVLPANVPVKPVQLIDFAPVLPEAIVQVTAPDVASKNTSSADVGTLAPPAPPTVEAHLVPAVPSQDAVPPRQNLSAMFTPPQLEALLPQEEQ